MLLPATEPPYSQSCCTKPQKNCTNIISSCFQAYICFYVFLLTSSYWITDVLHPVVVSLVPIVLYTIIGATNSSFVSDVSECLFFLNIWSPLVHGETLTLCICCTVCIVESVQRNSSDWCHNHISFIALSAKRVKPRLTSWWLAYNTTRASLSFLLRTCIWIMVCAMTCRSSKGN